ncbi:Imm45 family immunity protein [Nocardia vinacea]|uniref:Imm45 family immunity protein n=1 Tax=Nocardia vinacea TaxID=96468 RepID=UPI00343494BF
MPLYIDEVAASWEPLCTTGEPYLCRGAVLRYPSDAAVFDLMLIEQRPSRWGLMRVTGYKAGILVAVLPIDAHHPQVPGISAAWLRQHWNQWVHLDSRPEDVFVAAEGYHAVRRAQ